MVDMDEHNYSDERVSADQTPSSSGMPLTQWVYSLIGMRQLRIRSRLRGNHLHILCEHQDCPGSETIVPPLIQGLTRTALEKFLPPGSPPVYRVIVYGRAIGQATAGWTEAFNVHPSAASPQAEVGSSNPAPSLTAGTQDPTFDLAKQGNPGAIARHLSQVFSPLSLSVRARVEAGMSDSVLQRILIRCESSYPPDPLLLAEPIAQQLRQLELQQFRDAVVFGQVQGEIQPEWVLRVDLTPPEEILKQWARWGDVQAMTRLLNRALISTGIQVAAILKDSTLHLSCYSVQATPPVQGTSVAAIAPLLQALLPQGIQGVTLYGMPLPKSADPLSHPTGSQTSPCWIDWLDLPAKTQPELAFSTLELSQQGNLAAIAFLLTRLLNPDLDQKLATGGIRVQVRQKGDLLHIMTDAPNCPRQSQVAPAIVRLLQPLQPQGIAGVRVYGRRAGQRAPLWHYGADFVGREARVPEITPDFSVSDAYLGDLLAPPGALVLYSDIPADDWRLAARRRLEEALQAVQQILIRTQLFVPLPTALSASSESAVPASLPQQRLPLALVWGTVGLLLVLQSDWMLGQMAQSRQQSPEPVSTHPAAQMAPPPTPATHLPDLSLQKSKLGDRSVFSAADFTGTVTETVDPNASPEVPLTATPLPATPLQLKPQVPSEGAAYPTFNSRQFDIQLAVYRSYLEVQGAPHVLVIGSSRALRGVDPVALETALAEQGYQGMKVFNLGINGATAQVVNLLIQKILPQDKLPKLILFADGARAFNSERQDITYNGMIASKGYQALLAGNPPIPGATAVDLAQEKGMPRSDGTGTETATNPYQALNQGLNQWIGRLSLAYSQRDRVRGTVRDTLASLLPQQKVVIDLTDSALNTTSPTVLAQGQDRVDVDGFLALSIRFNPATYHQKYARVSGDYDSDYESFNLEGQQTEALAALAQYGRERQIPVVFVNLPLTQDYLDPTRKRHEIEFQQSLLRLAPQLGFIYRDLSHQPGLSQPDYFSDPSHLNRYGAYEVSRYLARDVMIPWRQAQRFGGAE